MIKRVVITGMGIVSPLGNGVDHTWKKLISSVSGIKKITHFETSDLAAQIGGIVPRGQNSGEFDPDAILEPKEQKKIDDFIFYGIAAAQEAIHDSGWLPTDEDGLERTGVLIGSGIGGLNRIYDTSVILHEQGPRRVSPFFIPASLINLISGQVSIRFGFKGPNHAIVTACSTGAHAIGDAARLIQWGDADVMVAGGAESAIGRLGLAGFCAARSLSTSYNDRPEEASRPWDEARNGFVMGEGSGIVVLEEYEHAKKRGAKIYAELVGYGLSSDAYHITSPSETGDGAYRSMKMAINRAGLSTDQIGYINAHGTSTVLGDVAEVKAMKRLFGDQPKNLCVSSTKSSIGHLLGAAGSVEAIFTSLALMQGILPPTLNLHNPSPGCDLDFIPLVAREKNITYALSNSFGFGGTNASLVFKKI
jgi:3-oxoacyl-[acyl-carrier-protein] synthase II